MRKAKYHHGDTEQGDLKSSIAAQNFSPRSKCC